MKNKIVILITIFISLNCYSQIAFESGYFIDNNNKKTNCLVKNFDWKNNPTEIEYKLTENEDSKIADIEAISEFGIYDVSKYVRANVEIDRSSNTTKFLSPEKEPIFSQEKLFLKVLLEGKANLYYYEDKKLKRFFFNKDNSNIEQLVYKRYKIFEKNNEIQSEFFIGENRLYRQQLLNSLKCESLEVNDFKNLDYSKRELLKLFDNYNNCIDSEYISLKKNRNKNVFDLTIRPRLNTSSLSLNHGLIESYNIDFDNELTFGIGIELEYYLPFNNDRWSLLFEPTYQYYKSNISREASNVSGGMINAELDYSSIEVHFGFRYYIFFKDNKNSKMFFNLSSVFDVGESGSIDFIRNDGTILDSAELDTGGNFSFGIGYKYNEKFSLEINYQTARNLVIQFNGFEAGYQTTSLILGYTLF